MDQWISFRYLQWDDRFRYEKPYEIVSGKVFNRSKVNHTNLSLAEAPPQLVRSIRGSEEKYNLDQNGFEIVKHNFTPVDYASEADVEDQYLPQLESLIKATVVGADEVKIVNWRLRESVQYKVLPSRPSAQMDNPCDPLQPAYSVHVDVTPARAVQDVIELMGDRASALLEGRVRSINIWRPYAAPVEQCPLAFADGSCLEENKLVAVTGVKQHRLEETFLPLFDKNLKWHYLPHQRPNEVLLMKMFDSDRNVAASCCPHAAFDLASTDGSALPRLSIEARAYVFTYL